MEKNIILQIIFILLTSSNLMSQTTTSYFLVPYEESDLEPITQMRVGDYLELEFSNNNLTELFEDKKVLEYKKAFAGIRHNYLEKVYEVKLEESDRLADFLKNNLIELAELIEEPIPAYNLPDDYYLPDGSSNDYLELINAPQAWSLTIGNPDIIVGVSDTYFTFSHEELSNKIIQILEGTYTPSNLSHGTAVASLIAADTNNGLGTASIGYNTKLIGHNGMGYPGVWELSQITNVKVINMSWTSGQTYSAVQDTLYQHIRDDLNIVLVAASGNGPIAGSCGGGYGYCYPASYDSVISVTGVGSRYPIGTIGTTTNWKDVAERIIGDSLSVMNINDKVNIAAPAYGLFHATNTGGLEGSIDTYNNNSWGTSLAAPLVSGTAALMLAVNPDLTALQVKEILEATADDSIYDIPENYPYIGKLGAGRLNAYKAVLMAKCMAEPTGLDFYIKDNSEDFGEEPNITSDILWNSPDIWIRNTNDEEEEHENPQYDPTESRYVYVRVRNRGCQTSSGEDELTVYWTKATTSASYPNSWNGSSTFSNGALQGNIIGTVTIPELEAGEETILELEWDDMPYPNDYINLEPGVDLGGNWHFCLLAIIDSDDDSTNYSTSNLVKYNNNVAQKNITIIKPSSDRISGTVAVGNPTNQTRSFNLNFLADDAETGTLIFEEAEVRITLNNTLLTAWERGGKQRNNIVQIGSNVLLVTGDNASLNNLIFNSNEIGTLNLKFNFLTQEITDKEKYVYHVFQRYASNNEIVGGETYEIRKDPRALFFANAGESTQVDKNEPITLYAETINEPAVYNWYDSEGNLIYEGADFEVSVEVAKTYKLEIIALTDGYKDYSEVEVILKPNAITTLYPNPTSNQVTVSYKINQGEVAYLSVTGFYGSNISNNYILDIEENEATLDVSNYPQGLYSVALIVNGQIQDTTTLIKQ